MKQLPEDMLRQFWQDSKKEAPTGFSDAIMQNLPEHAPLPEALKKPLLSPKALGFLFACLAALAILLNSLGGSSQTAAPLYQPMQDSLMSGINWLNAAGLMLPSLGMLAAALILFIGLDRLLQRFLKQPHEQQ